jgi:DNA-binding transcriptional ArsR family regulator
MITYHTLAEVDSFLAALADSDRLKIIANLTQEGKSAEFLADELDIKQAKLMKHLALLENANLVSIYEVEGDSVLVSIYEVEGDSVYTFNQKYLETISRKVLSHPQQDLDLSSIYLDKEQKKIINNYFRADGSLKMIPTQKKKIKAISQYLCEAFNLHVDYSEKEVNAILSRYHPDTTTIRRYLIDFGFLARKRDGTRYWRLENLPPLGSVK